MNAADPDLLFDSPSNHPHWSKAFTVLMSMAAMVPDE